MVTFLHNRIHNVAEEFRRGTFAQRCSQLSFGVLCLFLLECSITGGGRYWEAGPVSIRILLGGLAAVLALPELLRNLGAYLKKPVIWLTVIFAVWLVFCAWRGIRAENRMDVLITDVKGFMWLLLVPVLVATVRSRQRLRVLLSWVLAGAVIQAAVILAVNAGVVLMDDPAPLCRWLNEHAVGIVDVVSARLVRVFFKSSPYMVVACVIALFRQAQAPKLRWRYVLAVSLLLCALLLSFTRSLYGALGLTAVLSITAVLILCPAGRKRVLAFLLAAVVCFGVMSTVQEIVLEGSYLSFAVSRTVGREIPASWASQLRQRLRGDTPGNQPDSSEMDSQRSYIEVTERSDQLRQETKDGLKVYIRRSPVIGCGLGASAANREKGVDEYFYLDMLARTGIVGLVLYILPFGYVVLWCLRRRSLLRECPEGAAVVCGLCTFWVVTWFNPWMNAVLGIAWYAVTLSPSTATKGRLGFSRAPPMISSSRATSRPDTAGRKAATPAVEAWARCTVPKASETYSSAIEASSRANSGSFFSSRGSKRRFSSSMIWPPCRAAALALASSPTMSLAKMTSWLSSWLSRSATGRSVRLSFHCPLGLPR